TSGVALDLPAMMARKDKVVRGLTQGVAGLFKKNKVEWVAGTARLEQGRRVIVGERRLEAERVLIATGSEPTPLGGLPFDGERIVSSTEALALARVPERLLVIGAGAVGLELGSVWSRLGARVTVVEFLDAIVPTMDRGMGAQLKRALEKQGLVFRLETSATRVERTERGVRVTLESKGQSATEEADVVLVAIGGLSEEEAARRGVRVSLGAFPFMANGRARCLGETEGGVKVLADAQSDRIVGLHILGPRASDLIAEAALAVEFGASAEDVARTVHAHPTLPEAVKEAALAVAKRA